MNSGVVRCEEAADSMYESIDLLADKLDRQVKNSKIKLLALTKPLSELMMHQRQQKNSLK